MDTETIFVGAGIDRGGMQRETDSVEELRLTKELKQKAREVELLNKKISELRENVYGLCASLIFAAVLGTVITILIHQERKATNQRFVELQDEIKSRTIPSPPTRTVAPPLDLSSQPYEQDTNQR